MSVEQAIAALTAELAAIRKAVEYLALEARLRRVQTTRAYGPPLFTKAHLSEQARGELEEMERRILNAMDKRADALPEGGGG